MTSPLPPPTLVDWLDDLCVRFLLNLPSAELSSVPRLCFQVEEAQWFYEDFVRPAVQASGAPPLPHLPLRQFCLLLFQHCPLLSGFTDAQHLAAYEEFLAYKVRVPVRGAILLDEKMEKLVLVRGWKKGASWSFPRGKINKDERDLDCAMREVYEETGFDIAASGLLPDDYYDYEEGGGGEDDGVKYIDITMREQHIRLFVFRGVPEDTYFETKTRKEISKIQWYAIKDLPGFKKHKHHSQQSEAETAHANKFYMVAPFLGPLKKWIHQQRKNDIAEAQQRAARNSALAAEMTGTEDDTEDQMLEQGVSVDQRREEELKKLLSIGAAPSPAAGNTSAPPVGHDGSLLATLQGGGIPSNGGHIPHTPFDQINAFPPQQPETPQPQHIRQPSVGQFQQQHGPPPPQFPFSPQRLQQEHQRNFSLPTPHVFGPAVFPPNLPSGFPPGGIPPHLQQQSFLPRPKIPGPPPPSFGPQNTLPFPGPAPPQPQMPLPPHNMPQPFHHPPPPNAAFTAPQGALASGPSAPKASQLPPPKLNAHTMKLLDAFKSGGNNKDKAATPPVNRSGQQAQRPSSTHQAALLDLFKKPSASDSSPVQERAGENKEPEEPLSPALTDVTVKPRRRPPGMEERRPTWNEITRTLPIMKQQAKVKTPPSAAQQGDRSFEYSSPEPAAVRERPKSMQLFDPNENQMKPVNPTTTKVEGGQESPPIKKILQRPPPSSPKQGSRSRSPGRSKQPATSSPSTSSFAKSATQNGGQQPQPPPFTILARPGSSKGPKSPALPVGAPESPLLRNDDTPKPAFQPQVLKRPKGADVVVEGGKRGSEGNEEEKKEQLLALFGKGGGAGTTSSQLPRPQVQVQGAVVERGKQDSAATERNKNKNENANALLDLFNTDSSRQEPYTPSPPPPPAPRLSPASSKKTPPVSPRPQGPTQQAPPPYSHHHHRPQSSQQSLLLDLFHNHSKSSNISVNSPITKNNSPGTPISPFTLGTPTMQTPAAAAGAGGKSMSVEGKGEGKGKEGEKEFLMGYLNGVVRGEGYRGAGGGSGGSGGGRR